ncbi:protein VARIATION IN COMPOUND TRIGGERED ROOT growth response-like isoform X1 [Raphanus sativus]|uniref:ADP-ribosyl cyclase/cyclic ADP-ribose hydrolase n=1 Tax=Raphanus sativus TaxID=3726 RepID=A0A9W3DM19_RAPSA|nr:protein VARIATION IN COMPOUND TRIGGERED ROOT growth response-like isoform X1 [Raphanus sativus]
MASPSFSSSSSPNWRYDVFPSFRGEDIRKNFLSHFLKELERKMISAFKDMEMERSQSIWPEIVHAIRESRIAVVLFSKNYASSVWCLNELLEIMRCREELGQIVIPVFYVLDPSQVRKQNGDFGKIFNKTCQNKTKQVKEQWQKALTDVANILGFHSENCAGEAKMIEEITNDVLGKLKVTPSEDFGNFVGLKDHMKNMSSLLDLESKEVKMVGIWGPSGIGKTTIARALYSRLLRHFQGRIFIDRSFISKSKEIYSKANDYNMKLHLQEQFLSKLLGKESIQVDHLGAVRERLKHRKVLIFIDDLDDKVVLDALVGQNQWFGSWSRIIVVTTDKHLLKSHGIDCIYEVDFPSEKTALEMLCRYAFNKNVPDEGFEKLAVEVAQLAGSLPLGLRVLGSYLRGRGKDHWISSLPILKDSLDVDIKHVLRFSYEGLSEEDQALFRHIACLFNLEKVDDIKLLLEDSFKSFEIGFANLVAKSLVHVRLNIVEMHTLLQLLGKEIVREQSRNPGKREFIVNSEDICDVLEDSDGTKRVLGISLNIDEIGWFLIHENAFKKMGNLRFLTIFTNKYMLDKKVHLPDSFDHLPPKLKLLCWEGYPMKSLPSNFCPERLVKLKMKNSKLEKLWEGSWNLTCLKEVNLWGSENLKEIPDLSRATNLEKLYLCYRLSWVKIPSSMQIFNNLTKVETLPTPINHETTKGLHVAEFCMDNLKFEKLVEGIQPLMCMGTMLPTSLKVLFLSDISNMVELPFSIQNLNNLTDMKIIRCMDLEILPTGINLVSLERLNLNGCSRLKTFPDISRNISSLYLEETAIEEVPPWTENFSKLKYLLMQRCGKLEYVYLNVSKLKHLELVNFSHCGELTGADLSGYPSGTALEGEIIGTELQASSSIPDNNVPKVEFSFINCFKLDEEDVLQQLSYEKLILSGEEMPLYFTHRTTGTSMAFPLAQTPHSPPFFRFRVCAVAVFDSKPTSGTIGVFTKVNCQFKSRLGSYYESPYQHDYFSVYQNGSYLLLLDCVVSLKKDNATPTEVDYDYVNIQFHMSSSKFKLKEWGIRLSEDCSSVENRVGYTNAIPQICEADEDNVVNAFDDTRLSMVKSVGTAVDGEKEANMTT